MIMLIVMIYFYDYHSSKLNLTTVRKSTANEVVGLLSFLIVWIWDTVNMVLLRRKNGVK